MAFCGKAKGQVLTTELLLSVSIFLAALLAFLVAWNSITGAYSNESTDGQMANALLRISDSLALSQGEPLDWEIRPQGDAVSLGLAQSQNVLSYQKLYALCLRNSTYDYVREQMGAGRFEAHVLAAYPNGTEICGFGIGAPDTQGISSVEISRTMLLNGEVAALKVQLWRRK